MGFMSGFAKGFSEAQDRKQAREIFLGEQSDKKKALIMELAIKRGQSVTGGGGADAQHAMGVLKTYGLSDEKIAKLNAEGGATALTTMVDFVEKNSDPNFAMPKETLELAADRTISTVQGGGQIKYEDLADEFGLELTKEDKMIFDLSLNQPATVKSTTAYTPLKPVNQEDIIRTKKEAESDLTGAVTAEVQKADAVLRDPNSSDEDRQRAASISEQATAALDGIKAGDVSTAINLTGFNPLLPYIENDPRLGEVKFGGGWDSIQQQPAEEGPTEVYVEPIPEDSSASFASEQEAMVAAREGKLKVGDTIMINGVARRVTE